MASIPEKAKPQVGEQNKGAAWLLGGLGLVSGVPALVGIGTGELPQMVRNHPALTLIALGSVLVAVACGFIAAYVVPNNSRRERILLIAGVLLMVGGLLAAVAAGIRTWRDQPEPTVTAVAVPTPEGTKVRLTVKASGVRAKDDVTVLVHPLIRRHNEGRGDTFQLLPPIHGASLGPNTSGEIDYATEVSVPSGRQTDVEVRAWIGETPSHCYAHRGKTGCVTVALDRDPEAPQLVADWKDATDAGKGLAVSVSTRELAGRHLSLYVEGRAARGRPLQLARASWAPDSRGTIQRTLTVPVESSVASVCVVASALRARLRCPSADDAWIQLRAPRARTR